MAKQVILTGTSPNDKTGDKLRDAFNKINANFNELYSITGADAAANELVNGTHIVSLGTDGALTMPDGLTIDNSVIGYSSSTTVTEETPGGTISSTTALENQISIDSTNSIIISNITTQINNDGVVTATDSVGSTLTVNNTGATIRRYVEPDGPNNSQYFQIGTTNSGAVIEGVGQELTGNTIGRVTATQGVVDITTSIEGANSSWLFDMDGTLNLPSRFPVTFTATVDPAHYAGEGSLTLEGDAWWFEVSFVIVNGYVETQITNNTPWPSNPGYSNGFEFRFTVADHGIPGYTFTLTLTDIQNPGMFMYTTNLAASVPPTLPSTISSPETIKLTSDATSWAFSPNGKLTLPTGGDIVDITGTSVLGTPATIDGGNASTVF